MTNNENFLFRKLNLERLNELKRLIIFGYVISFLSLFFGWYNYFITQETWDEFWYGLGCFGFFGIFVTLVFPYFWYYFEKTFHFIGNSLGKLLLLGILTALYGLIVIPTGYFLIKLRGKAPIFEWNETPSSNLEGWKNKAVPTDIYQVDKYGFYRILSFFVTSGNYFLLPLIFILLVLGLVLFFLQTSVVAPFIYTLF